MFARDSRTKWMRCVPAVVAASAVALAGCGKQESLYPTKEELPKLTRLLKDPSPKVRQQALDRIRYLQADAAEALPQLLAMWEDEDPLCRTWAADAVGLMGEPAVSEIKQRLTSESAQIRALAWASLKSSPLDARIAHVEELNPFFVKGFLDDDAAVRRESAYNFMLFGSLARGAAPSIIDALTSNKEKWSNNSTDKRVICCIVAGFQNFEPKHLEQARPLVPLLKELMKSNDEQVRGVSTGLLRQLGEIPADDGKSDPGKAPPGSRTPPKPRAG